MPGERIRIGGQYLDRIGRVSDRVDSTIVRYDGLCGDYQASCTFTPPKGFNASWLHRGALYESVGLSGRRWGGVTAEPTVNDDGSLSLTAYGFGDLGNEYQSMDGTTPTWVPNDAVDAQIDDEGLPWKRLHSLGSNTVSSLDDQVVTIAGLLVADAVAKGRYPYIDSFGEVTYLQPPTTATWITRLPDGFGGTADPGYVTHLYAKYVSSVDGTTGQPNGWSYVLASDDVAAAKFGRKSSVVDITGRGYLSGTDAQDIVDGAFSLYGGRMGFTSGLDLDAFTLRRLGFGRSNPLSLYGRNGAGTIIRVPGIIDSRSSAAVAGHVDVLIGQVTRFHDEARAAVEPIGFEPRDLQSALDSATVAERVAKSPMPAIFAGGFAGGGGAR